MDKRKLVFGLGVLLIVVGALLALFTPGGLFNHGGSAAIVTPIGTLNVREEPRGTAGPIAGYVLLGVGGLALVIAFAMKPPHG